METVDYTRFVLAFIFVVGLIGVFYLLLKKYGNLQSLRGMKEGEVSRLRVLETRFIDTRRKLVLVQRDEVQHLLLLADGREMVIESFKTMSDER